MHLLYLDESGQVADPKLRYFVLAGVALNERATHWVEKELDAVAARFAPLNPKAVELHGSAMRSGRDGWKAFPLADRLNAIKDALRVGIVKQSARVRLFGAVIKKSAAAGKDPVEMAFEQMSSRFDYYLNRLRTKYKDKQRGLIVFDKASTEFRIQSLARNFKITGHSYGKSMNYAEVPVFLDSKASRMIQLADLVAFGLLRFHEYNDNSFYDIYKFRFDTYGGVQHGYYVYL